MSEVISAIADHLDSYLSELVHEQIASAGTETADILESLRVKYEAAREQFTRCRLIMQLMKVEESKGVWGENAYLRGEGGDRATFVVNIPSMPGEKRERKPRTAGDSSKPANLKVSGLVFVHENKVIAGNALACLRALKRSENDSVKSFCERVFGRSFENASEAKHHLTKSGTLEGGFVGKDRETGVSIYRTEKTFKLGDEFTVVVE